MLKKIIPVIILAAVLVLWLAPIGPLPGVFIGGSETPAPLIWEETTHLDEVRLKVNGFMPRVVIIWIVQVNKELYVVGNHKSGWVRRLGKDDSAILRIGEKAYSVVAKRETENRDDILNAYIEKYRPNYPDLIDRLSHKDAIKGAVAFKLSRP